MAGMIRTLLLAALGGAIGSSLRAAFGLALPFPVATVAVNVLGSFAIGLLAVPLLLAGERPHPMAPFLVTGILGGFTTFSAFSLDALRLIEDGQAGAAVLYVGGSVALSLGAAAAGLALARGLA
jgi:CrcB protein